MANPRNRSRSTDQGRRGFIHAYGLFWDAEEINWTPRAGQGGRFQILGRIGEHRPGLQVCDFRRQRGLYVLYDNYGPFTWDLHAPTHLGVVLNRITAATGIRTVGLGSRGSVSVVFLPASSLTGRRLSARFRKDFSQIRDGRSETSKRS
jgi:hypothetical protein